MRIFGRKGGQGGGGGGPESGGAAEIAVPPLPNIDVPTPSVQIGESLKTSVNTEGADTGQLLKETAAGSTLTPIETPTATLPEAFPPPAPTGETTATESSFTARLGEPKTPFDPDIATADEQPTIRQPFIRRLGGPETPWDDTTRPAAATAGEPPVVEIVTPPVIEQTDPSTAGNERPKTYPGPYGKDVELVQTEDGWANRGGPPSETGEPVTTEEDKDEEPMIDRVGEGVFGKIEGAPADDAAARQRARETAGAVPGVEVVLPGEGAVDAPINSTPGERPSENDLQLAINRKKYLETATPEQIIRDNPGISTSAGAEAFRNASLVEQQKIIDRSNGINTATETGAPAPKTPEENAARLQEHQAEKGLLITKLESGQPLTKEENERLKILNREIKDLSKNPNAAFEAAVERAKKGEPIEGDDEILTGTESAEKPKTSEQIAAENEEELERLDKDWRETAGKGKNPGEAMIAYMKKDAEMRNEPIPENEIAELRKFMKEVYKDGVKTPEGRNSAEIRKRFIELGQLEAQIIALKHLVKDMKEKESEMKKKVDGLEDSYHSEKDDTERIKRLNAWRTAALQLEGYQMATNDQAKRGRQANIQRREAAGYIHRKLGTKVRLGSAAIGNMLYGAGTAYHEMADVFLDVTIDQARRFA